MSQITIGKLIETLLLSGKSAEQTLVAVKRVFPNCQTTLKCVYYYSSKLKKSGRFNGLAPTQQINVDELKKVMKEVA